MENKVKEISKKFIELIESTKFLEAVKSVLKYKSFQESAKANFEICKNLIGATAGYVALLSEDGSENELLFLDSGGVECTVDPTLPMPIRGLRAVAYETGKAIFDNDFENSEWMKYIPSGHSELKNVLFAPLKIENKTVGLIGLANKPSEFNEIDIKIVSAFSELTAIALHNSIMVENLEKTQEKYHRAFDRAEFYKDLFAHDINNILQSINTATGIVSELSENFEDPTEFSEILNIIESQIKRGSNLVKNVRKISQISNYEKELKLVNVIKVIREVAAFIVGYFPRDNISIDFDFQMNEFYVLANEFLQDLFENLLLNSVQHNQNNEKEIKIITTKESINNKEDIKIQIIDNGIGISDLMKDLIFTDKMKQNKASRGMGLGLTIVKNIVDSYHGEIWVEDKVKGDPSQGTNFVILFPRGE